MKSIISVLVENKPGVLARISSLFSARGFNIDSLSVGETENSEFSRMTIVVDGDEKILDQVKKQLNKLIDTVKVVDITNLAHLERELVLIKVKCERGQRTEIIQICEIFRAKIIDFSFDSLIIEITGDEDKIESFIQLIKPFEIIEIARSGLVGLARGNAGRN